MIGTKAFAVIGMHETQQACRLRQESDSEAAFDAVRGCRSAVLSMRGQARSHLLSVRAIIRAEAVGDLPAAMNHAIYALLASLGKCSCLTLLSSATSFAAGYRTSSPMERINWQRTWISTGFFMDISVLARDKMPSWRTLLLISRRV